MRNAGVYFRKRCAANAEFVEAALHSAIDRRAAQNQKEDARAHLWKVIDYAVFAGGRRLRPNFVVESARLFAGRGGRGEPESTLTERFAASIELVHGFSLAHDDLPAMDDDDMRRGRPSVHKKYGEAAAILAGDMILSLAFAHLLPGADEKNTPQEDKQKISDGHRQLAQAAMEMIQGQSMDLRQAAQTPQAWEEIARCKTGALFAAACALGAIAGGADAPARRMLYEYGVSAGIAYQIMDDLGDRQEEQHDPSSNNFAVRFGRAAARTALAEHADNAGQALAALDAPFHNDFLALLKTPRHEKKISEQQTSEQ